MAVVVNHFATFEEQNAHVDHASNELNSPFFHGSMKMVAVESTNNVTSIVGLLNHVGSEVQNPQNSSDAEDFGTEHIDLRTNLHCGFTEFNESFNSRESRIECKR